MAIVSFQCALELDTETGAVDGVFANMLVDENEIPEFFTLILL